VQAFARPAPTLFRYATRHATALVGALSNERDGAGDVPQLSRDYRELRPSGGVPLRRRTPPAFGEARGGVPGTSGKRNSGHSRGQLHHTRLVATVVPLPDSGTVGGELLGFSVSRSFRSVGLASAGRAALSEGILALPAPDQGPGKLVARPSPCLSAGIAWEGPSPRAEPLRLSHPGSTARVVLSGSPNGGLTVASPGIRLTRLWDRRVLLNAPTRLWQAGPGLVATCPA
jgi:hypothetical protein